MPQVSSDEPTRVENIVVPIFSGEQGREVKVARTSGATLLAGVEAQDDCAVFAMDGRQELVVGSDYVRGPKFRLYEHGFLDEYDIGYYLVAANVSDVVAMGARPIGILTVIRYPPSMDDNLFARLLEGVRAACNDFGAPSVGGDIGSAERIILSASALGICAPGRSLRRAGAKPGDILCLTGPTGLAGAAMEYLKTGKISPSIESDHRETLLKSWRRPKARVREGITLGEFDGISSCQDTSDGLKAAIESLGFASNVGFEIREDCLAIEPAVLSVCEFLGLDPLSIVMGDSVDFQLAFTVAPHRLDALRELFASEGLHLNPIGVANPDRNHTGIRRTDGSITELPGRPWRHTPDRPAST